MDYNDDDYDDDDDDDDDSFDGGDAEDIVEGVSPDYFDDDFGSTPYDPQKIIPLNIRIQNGVSYSVLNKSDYGKIVFFVHNAFIVAVAIIIENAFYFLLDNDWHSMESMDMNVFEIPFNVNHPMLGGNYIITRETQIQIRGF